MRSACLKADAYRVTATSGFSVTTSEVKVTGSHCRVIVQLPFRTIHGVRIGKIVYTFMPKLTFRCPKGPTHVKSRETLNISKAEKDRGRYAGSCRTWHWLADKSEAEYMLQNARRARS